MKKGIVRKRQKPVAWTDLSRFVGIHTNQRCFVVGASPSLAFLDISKIHYHVVIAVNSAALLMPWDHGDESKRFWLSNDALCLQWTYFYSHVLKAHCTKLVRTSWRKQDEEIRNHDFQYFAPRKQDVIIDSNDGGLCSVSSIPTAIDFALLMGCKPIYLLGVDQRMVHGNSHFWQFWDQSKWPQRMDKERNFRPEQKHQAQVFDQNIKVFVALKHYADQQSTPIYNCSSRSRLEIFPKIAFEESLI